MILRVAQALFVSLVLLVVATGAVRAQVDKKVEEVLRRELAQPEMNLSVESIEASQMPGIYAVQFAQGPLVYAAADGKFFIAGDLYSTAGDKLVNLTEQRRDVDRKRLLAAVPKGDMIVFPAQGQTKAYISVFTDVTCFYCQKLHLEVPELNRQGVEVRYLAYPRGGMTSDGYNKLATAWCSEDPQDTLTKLKAKKAVPQQLCDDNPIAGQFQLGQSVGVRGTPAIVTQDGRLIPGYKAANDLIADLGLK